MSRSGGTWKSYLRLMAWVASFYSVTTPPRWSRPRWMTGCWPGSSRTSRASSGLRRGGGWDGNQLQALPPPRSVHRPVECERRSLLAGGGHFQLIEKLGKDLKRDGIDEQAALAGLNLSGKLVDQRRQLADYLEGEKPTPQGRGWLKPNPQTRRQVRLYGSEPAWVYKQDEIDFVEGLHPAVARSLIARYVKGSGVVVDPMAGGGMIAKVATALGHQAWASDLLPEDESVFL